MRAPRIALLDVGIEVLMIGPTRILEQCWSGRYFLVRPEGFDSPTEPPADSSNRLVCSAGAHP
jgi:hypothetical protein